MINFPDSPTLNQIFRSGTQSWYWDTVKWVPTNSPPTVPISDTPPTSALAGTLWWDSVSGNMYIRFDDGTSSQWVTVVNQLTGNPVAIGMGGTGATAAPQALVNLGALAKGGDSMTGALLLAADPTAALQAATKQYTDAISGSTRNLIVNSGMQISQENGSTAGTTSGYYPVDCVVLSFSNAGSQSVQQVASITPGNSPNRVRVTVTGADTSVAAGDFCQLNLQHEGYRVAALEWGTASAKRAILRFGVRAPAGTYCATFRSETGRSYIAEYTISAGEANTDVVRTIIIPGDTTGTWNKDNSTGLGLRFGLMWGTTYQDTPNTWVSNNNAHGSANQYNFMGTNGNVFELFDVGLYVDYNNNGIAPVWQLPDYGSELLLCKRYFYSGTPPLVGTFSSTTAFSRSKCYHPVPMRTTPTLTFASALPVFDGAATGTFNTVTANYSTADILEMDATCATGTFTVGKPMLTYQGTAGNLKVSARP